MEEDEEIDIVGNYDGFMGKNESDISNLSSGQLLSCEYTVHPNWINENADGGNYWSDSVPKNENIENNVEVLQSEEVVIEEPEPVPNILEWPGEEDLVFVEDIPATVEVVVGAEEDSDSQEDTSQYDTPSSPLMESEIYAPCEPAAFETHPPVKSFEYIGPTNSRSLLKAKLSPPPLQTHPRSILKANVERLMKDKPEIKFRQTLTVKQSILDLNQRLHEELSKTYGNDELITHKTLSKKPKTKFKQTIHIKQNHLKSSQLKLFTKNVKKVGTSGVKRGLVKGKRTKTQPSFFGENVTISHEGDLINVTDLSTKTPQDNMKSLPTSSPESDIEIDIESEEPTVETPKLLGQTQSNDQPHLKRATTHENLASKKRIKEEAFSFANAEESPTEKDKKYFYNTSKSLPPEILDVLKTLNVPTTPLIVNLSEISGIERVLNAEFFDHRSTKTAEQYLRIRNHILQMWETARPNYVSKTSVRTGLKHAGDVNCISRIHRLLEQLGAINFDCVGKNFEYLRPIEDHIALFAYLPARLRNTSSTGTTATIGLTAQMERRQRIRTNNFREIKKENVIDDSNYTIVHIDGVQRPAPPIFKSRDNKRTTIPRTIKTELDLVKCLRFSRQNPAPFKVSITLSTLLCLQLHSLSSNFEVMGFIGGHRSKLERSRICLSRYKPCRTASQSSTTCEMCPVSQVEQASCLTSDGYELLGWYHSHPLFPANPSRTDVRTQKEMQLQFSFDENRPFIGLILSCLNMAFKCVYILPKELHNNYLDSIIPYEMDVIITKDCVNLKRDIQDVIELIRDNEMDERNSSDNSSTAVKNIIEKLKVSCDSIITQLGFNKEIFFQNIF